MDASEPTKTVSHLPEAPLAGRTIILTRPREQQEELARLLEGYGAQIILLPTIAITAPRSWAALDQAIGRLASYDWVVFTSANGVKFFFQRLSEKQADCNTSALSTFAIGPATAQALQTHGAPATLVAETSNAEGALAALIERVGTEGQFRGLKFLLPRARVARDLLPQELARRGAAVDVVEAYQTVKPDLKAATILQLFNDQTIAAITFTSSSTLANFAALVGRSDLSGLLKGVVVGCIGPITAQTALTYGLEDIVQPATYTAPALVESLVQALTPGKPA